jgi:hypothetical protein
VHWYLKIYEAPFRILPAFEDLDSKGFRDEVIGRSFPEGHAEMAISKSISASKSMDSPSFTVGGKIIILPSSPIFLFMKILNASWISYEVRPPGSDSL